MFRSVIPGDRRSAGLNIDTSLRAILLDVEGTTTPIEFVYGKLFPYVRDNLRSYLDAHGRSSEYEALTGLMDQDSKSTTLKDLQGRIWEEGYAAGELVGEVFEDVGPALKLWRQEGIDLGIFSSGSALAQQLLFRHSTAGDLTPLLRWHFDTTLGAKTDPDSYRRIASSIGISPSSVLFISDVVQELDAAKAAGLRTLLCVRPGNSPQPSGQSHPIIRGLSEVNL